MNRNRTLCVACTICWLGLAGPSASEAQLAAPSAQAPAAKAARPPGIELALLRSLQANPLTAPYQFVTEVRGKQVALKGRVATKQIHDVAIQTAIALGVPVVDEVVIDTAAAHQVSAFPAQGWYPGAGYAPNYPGAGFYGSVPYLYPQPILGKLDDPFYGFEPPAFSYPPWWGGLTARRLGPQPGATIPAPPQNVPPPQSYDPAIGPTLQISPDGSNPPATSLPYGTIEMAIDPRGIATLRGAVPSLAERITLGQRVAQTPGVTQVVNLLNVQAPPLAPPSDTPPPPPVPVNVPAPPAPAPGPAIKPGASAPPDGSPIVADSDPLAQRAARAIASRSGLASLPVRVKVREGVASVSGKVPTVYEAMLAYRAVQQTPGIREIEDKLEFDVPDGTGPNPLVEKGRPEDVEPYLEAQIRRQVGDLAHIDRIRVQGNALDLRGTLGREEDRNRFDAILRSLPILRGFRLTAEVPAESR
jgi:hypothetical protein